MALSEEDKQWFRSELGAFTSELGTIRSEFTSELGTIRSELETVKAQIERVETSLLTEFHKWASPVEARQRSHAAAIRAMDAEMEALTDRVKNLEQRP